MLRANQCQVTNVLWDVWTRCFLAMGIRLVLLIVIVGKFSETLMTVGVDMCVIAWEEQVHNGMVVHRLDIC